MKKIALIISILTVITTFMACTSSKKQETQNEIKTIEKVEVIENFGPKLELGNHSFLSEENIGQKVTITGILKKGTDVFYIVENSESRSSVTFTISVSEDQQQSCEALVENKVSVTGVLTAADSPWTKEMTLTEIKSL